MTLTMSVILFGALLVYAGWKNLSVRALLQGDNTVGKPAAAPGVAAAG